MSKINPDSSQKSIRTRLMGNFILIILISVLAFEALLMYFTRFYFYSNIESILTNQIKTASDFYTRYFSNVPLIVNLVDNAEIFWKQTNAHVQIVKLTGEVILDSEGNEEKEKISTEDFNAALNGEKGVWIGKENRTGERIMAVAYPLKSDLEQVGVLRYITSLEDVDNIIFNISLIFICIGATVILVAIIISMIFAHSLVHPIKNVMGAARLMAEGNLDIRIKKDRNDEIGKLSDTLNHMAKEIQNRDNIKNDFISMVSHELRTPLTSIKGWANTIIDDDFSDREILKDGLHIIVNESDRLSDMVEELLDFSRFVSGKVELKKEKTNVKAITDYIRKHMSTRAQEDNIKFTVLCDGMPEVKLDINKINQVLINLLGNSFKFTQAGGEVTLNAFRDNESLVFEVSDNGCGISAEDLPLVRDKFYKGKSSKSQTGLGLSICDEIVKLHQGSMDIKSELNRGTVVRVELPCF